MADRDIQRIQHMLVYCDRIVKTVARYGSSFNTFISDYDFFDSIAMKVMQIGELAGGLSEEFKEKTKNQIHWGLIRGMRNFFAHEYTSINKNIVWDVVVKDIPTLLDFCEKVIKEDSEREKPSIIAALEAGESKLHVDNAQLQKDSKHKGVPEL
jgi:uncharacterized protein with HEPN domain